MNWSPPTNRFFMSTLHHVQRRSGNSVRDASEAGGMRVLFLSAETLSTDSPCLS
jgi:hypothetical protein